MRSERWLVNERQRLLDCSHFHVVFTIPQQLHPLWRFNYGALANVLFRVATESLLELLDDPKYLGARPGLLAALHTWTKQLTLHPHLHVLVTGGGLTGDGEWKVCKGRYLVPFRVLMHKFRGKLRAALIDALDAGGLTIPPSTTPAQLRGLFNRVGRMAMNVKILERYEHGQGVAVYLARYLRGGPLSNRRLVSHRGGEVAFRYLDRRDASNPQTRIARLPEERFLLRYLQHVPPKSFMVVRRYGVYASAAARSYQQARTQCGMLPPQLAAPAGYSELMAVLGIDVDDCCDVCGKPLHWKRIPPPPCCLPRAPPGR